jgi:hypothetical protein
MVTIFIAEEQYSVISDFLRIAGKNYLNNHFKDLLIFTRETSALGDISRIAWKGLRNKNNA